MADTVRIVSRRMVRPASMPASASEDIQLTPWDLVGLNVDYIQRGILLPKPPAEAETSLVVDALPSSLAHALGRYYHFAGRLGTEEHGDGTVTVLLRCTGEGAELVHAVAPGLAVADVVVGSPSVYTPPPVVRSFFPLNGACGADAAMDTSLPVLSAQVTELADGVFVGMSMNHVVGAGTCFWGLFNAWSAVSRGGEDELARAVPPALVHQRGFLVDTSPVPVPVRLPSGTLEDLVRRRRSELPRPLRDGFFTFSAASVKKLKARANGEMLQVQARTTTTISSLQAMLAHLWRAVSRARGLPARQETRCVVLMGCRGRIRDIPPGYVGNAIAAGMTEEGCTVGDILDKGLGWTAWQLNRAVESFDEVKVREWLDRWVREPTTFFSPAPADDGGGGGALLAITSSTRFDVFGNDFGWGKPVGVWSGPGEKDGKVSMFQGPGPDGSMSLEVSLTPEAMERLVADHEFMEAVAEPPRPA